MKSLKRVHLFVSGRVQGVGFRASTAIRAKILGLKGFVRNLEDGRVEAIIEGEDKKVDKLVEWTRRGPMFAKVIDTQVMKKKYLGEFDNFKIVY